MTEKNDNHRIALLLKIIDGLENRNREMSELISKAMKIIRENVLPWQRHWSAKVLALLEFAKIKGGGK